MTNPDYLRVGFDAERSRAAPFSGSAQTVGSALTVNPVVIVFDNQSTVSAAISIDGGSTTWKTFSAGQCFVLDLYANKGGEKTYTIPIGTQFTVTATGGTGSFRISIIYAR